MQADGGEIPVIGQLSGNGDQLAPRLAVFHHVVGRQHQQHRLRVLAQQLRGGQRDGGSRVAPGRLDQHLYRFRELLLVKAVADRVAQALVGDNAQRAGTGGDKRERAADGLQDERLRAEDGEKLLRVQLAGQRPKPHARAAGEDEDVEMVRGGLHRHARGSYVCKNDRLCTVYRECGPANHAVR
jgi:hypothetical protein